MTKLSTPKSQPYIITMGQFSSKPLNVYTVYTICTPSGISTRLALFVTKDRSFTDDDCISGHRHGCQRVTYSPDAPWFKGTDLAFTGITPTRKYPKKWDSLLHNLPATRMGGEQMLVATFREEAYLRCCQAQEMLERNGILMRSRGFIR